MALRNSCAMPADISPERGQLAPERELPLEPLHRRPVFEEDERPEQVAPPRRRRGPPSPPAAAPKWRLPAIASRPRVGSPVRARATASATGGHSASASRRRLARAENRGSPRSSRAAGFASARTPGGLDDEEPSRVRPDEGLRGDGEGVGALLRAPAHLLQLARPAPQLVDRPAEGGDGGPRLLPGSTPRRRAPRPPGRLGQGLERPEEPPQERSDEERRGETAPAGIATVKTVTIRSAAATDEAS